MSQEINSEFVPITPLRLEQHRGPRPPTRGARKPVLCTRVRTMFRLPADLCVAVFADVPCITGYHKTGAPIGAFLQDAAVLLRRPSWPGVVTWSNDVHRYLEEARLRNNTLRLQDAAWTARPLLAGEELTITWGFLYWTRHIYNDVVVSLCNLFLQLCVDRVAPLVEDAHLLMCDAWAEAHQHSKCPVLAERTALFVVLCSWFVEGATTLTKDGATRALEDLRAHVRTWIPDSAFRVL